MASVPKFPEFRISNTPNKNLKYTAVKLYSNRFEELRVANYKLSKVIETKVTGEVWTFYQFHNNNSYKYLVKLYIYSSQFSHCETENNPRIRIYGPYDGFIDEIIKERDNLKISKYQSGCSYEPNIYSIIDEIHHLKLRTLKIKCKEMELKVSGSKDELIYSILNKILNLEELISL